MFNTKLTGAKLSGANLDKTHLGGADLREVDHDELTSAARAITDDKTLGKWW
jgi:uncharacterized protein YjbI with pentapeptide repeats